MAEKNTVVFGIYNGRAQVERAVGFFDGGSIPRRRYLGAAAR
jgi:hypothetical protein